MRSNTETKAAFDIFNLQKRLLNGRSEIRIRRLHSTVITGADLTKDDTCEKVQKSRLKRWIRRRRRRKKN